MTAKPKNPPEITPQIISRARRALWALVLATNIKKKPKRKGGRRRVRH